MSVIQQYQGFARYKRSIGCLFQSTAFGILVGIPKGIPIALDVFLEYQTLEEGLLARANSRLSDRKIKSLRPKEKDYRFCCWSEILAECCDCCGETKIAGVFCCESYGLPNLGLV